MLWAGDLPHIMDGTNQEQIYETPNRSCGLRKARLQVEAGVDYIQTGSPSWLWEGAHPSSGRGVNMDQYKSENKVNTVHIDITCCFDLEQSKFSINTIARSYSTTWLPSSSNGRRECWAGMSCPSWASLYQLWSPRHAIIAGTRPKPRPRHKWRHSWKRASQGAQCPLHLNFSVRLQRSQPRKNLHPKRTRLHGKTATGPRYSVGSDGDPSTPARPPAPPPQWRSSATVVT